MSCLYPIFGRHVPDPENPPITHADAIVMQIYLVTRSFDPGYANTG